ncbi:MAG: hypothetical protein K2O85_02895 [Helicobacter sp.]|nr:hypothetical protein [Helicobacter sp.]
MSFAWYAIQTYYGSERSVKDAIENLVREYKIQDRVCIL